MTIVAREMPRKWWESRKGDVARDVFALVGHIRKSTGSKNRRADDLHHMRLYGNYDVAGDARSSVAGAVQLIRGSDGRMRYNICSSAVNTAASVIAQQRPRPMVLTTAGDFAQQRTARLRTQALEAQLWDLGGYDLMPRVFVDGAVLGTGAVYGCLHPTTNKPHIERVLPLELVVDHDEAIDGKPRTIYRVRTFARDVLIAAYPSKKDALKKARGPSQDEISDLFLTRDTTSDRVTVVEAWHLGADKDRKDGRHVLAVDGVTLVDEEWTAKRLPFSIYRWSERQVGFWGSGLVEAARDPQWRINKLIARNERLNDLATKALLVEGNSRVKVEAITNKPYEIIRYYGTPPVELTTTGAHPALQQEIAEIREQFFSEQGISPMLAEGKKPSGLNSGQAQRTHDDIQSRRHVMNARAYEAAYMDLCELISDLNDAATEADSGYSVSAISSQSRSQSFRHVKWRELQIDEGDLKLRMFPTSALPTTPQGKWAAVQEWIGAGFVSRPFAMQLLDFPDLDAAARIELANLDYAMWQVEQILDGEQAQPNEYSDLEMCADIARRSSLQAEIMGAPEEITQALRDHVDACMTAVQEAAAAQQPQPPQPGMQAPPPPSALPQSGGPMLQ